MAELWVVNAGTVDYREALALQDRVREARQADAIPDTLVLLEHPPTYTRGRRTGPQDLPFAEWWYRERGIDIVDVPRGGKITYHCTDQLTGYPIMRTDDVVEHVRTMERALVAALADEGIEARQRTDEGPDYTGVWVEDRKIASIGVHVAKGVTAHGFAINVENDLTPFEWVVACGLDGVRMTSLQAESGRSGLMACFRKRVAWRFAEAHGLRQRLVSLARLEAAVAEPAGPVALTS
jgi:lipoyl(octanoyl) transferase